MAAIKESDGIDSRFFKTADAFFSALSSQGLTFDDVTLATLNSAVVPGVHLRFLTARARLCKTLLGQ